MHEALSSPDSPTSNPTLTPERRRWYALGRSAVRRATAGCSFAFALRSVVDGLDKLEQAVADAASASYLDGRSDAGEEPADEIDEQRAAEAAARGEEAARLVAGFACDVMDLRLAMLGRAATEWQALGAFGFDLDRLARAHGSPELAPFLERIPVAPAAVREAEKTFAAALAGDQERGSAGEEEA